MTTRASRAIRFAVPFLALLGCGGGTSSTTPVPSGDVHGTFATGYWSGAGVRTSAVPPAIAASPNSYGVAALSPVTGGYHRHPGTVSADGSFVIPGVEPGAYLLELKVPGFVSRYFALSGRQLDLGTEVFGSPSPAPIAGGTTIDFSLDGLDGASGATIGVMVPGVTLAIPAGSPLSTPGPGATSVTGSVSASGQLPAPGDTGWVTEFDTLAPFAGMTGTFRNVTRAGAFAANLVNGASTPIQVTLAAPAQGALTGSFPTASFETWRSQFGSNVATASHALSVTAVPFSTTAGPLQPSTGLASLALAEGAGDVPLATFAWGRYLPAAWHEVRRVSYTVGYDITAPGSTPTRLSTSMSIADPLEDGAPLAPRASPPRRPTVAARDALSPQAGVGTTPRLAWDAPDLGDGGNYVVTLYSVTPSATPGGPTAIAAIATFRVAERHLDLPDGVLVAGGSYTALILGVVAPHFDWARPLHTPLPNSAAPVLLAGFSP